MSTPTTSRRSRLATMVAAPVLVSIPAATAIAAHADGPVTHYVAAEKAFNADQIDEAEYNDALDALDLWQPPSAHDFVRKFTAVYGDRTCPNEERAAMILAQARRLLS